MEAKRGRESKRKGKERVGGKEREMKEGEGREETGMGACTHCMSICLFHRQLSRVIIALSVKLLNRTFILLV